MISIVFIMAASYRLARYNILADSEEKKNFLGLPVPVAAFALVSYIIFSYEVWGGLEHGQLLVTMIIALAIFMVSQIQYEALPDRYESRQEKVKLAMLLVAIPLLIFKPRLMLFPMVASYILLGMTRELLRLFRAGVGRVKGRNSRRRKDDGLE
jgi:CDP-diacylglycerol--serine O-phosphatidyltransferase